MTAADNAGGAPAADPQAAEALPAAPTPAKVDPETLVLRGSPRRAVRFRREIIIALAATGSLGIAGAAWIALKPTSFRMVAVGDDEPRRRGDAAADALAGTPGSYDAVPKLGPPLPGDLGRPILAHQRSSATVPVTGDAAADPAEARRQQAEAEAAAARQSGVMMSVGGKAGGGAPAMGALPPELPVPDLPADAPGGAVKAFGSSKASDEVNAHRIADAASPWILSSGSVIAASLITGLNSDVPGLVVAQVTENAYDSITGRTLLIPQGARLVGRYDDSIGFGQRRALVVWQRIIWPDGSSLRIDNVPATDASGQAGLADKVDLHTGQLLKGVALATLLGAGTELGFGDDESELVRAMREASQQNGARAGDRIVDRSLDIEPTIRVRPGSPLRVVVHKDLVLRPWRS